MDPPANLPNFRDLVQAVGVRAGTPPTTADFERMDRFLGMLTDRGVDVHTLVAQALDLDDSRPNRLHRAIIDVARGSRAGANRDDKLRPAFDNRRQRGRTWG